MKLRQSTLIKEHDDDDDDDGDGDDDDDELLIVRAVSYAGEMCCSFHLASTVPAPYSDT